MQFTSHPEMLSEPAEILGKLMQSEGVRWDQCLFRVESTDPSRWTMDLMYRHARTLDFLRSERSADTLSALLDGIKKIFSEIERVDGVAPKVGVLAINADGQRQFDFDHDREESLSISIADVGLDNSYFAKDDIDIPTDRLAAHRKEKKWRKLLAGCTMLELTYRDDALKTPCPSRNIELEFPISQALEAGEIGRILQVDCQGDNENLVWVWRIGAIKLDACIASIEKVLQALPMSNSVELCQISPTPLQYKLQLKSHANLVEEKANRYIKELVAESLRCSPQTWHDGMLTIQADTSHNIYYQIKNSKSRDKATISPTLRALCEEIVVLMWKNENRWSQADIAFNRSENGVGYKVKFSYNTAVTISIPEAVAQTDKPWWKFW